MIDRKKYKELFGEDYVEPKRQPHIFTKTCVGKKVCSRCGLMYLRNKLTEKAVGRGC